MIHVGISGADLPDSGELIRILAMHPDVVIDFAQARGFEGHPLTSVHHGLIGETDLLFTGTVDYTRLDVLFIVGNSCPTVEMTQLRHKRPDLKIILVGADTTDADHSSIVYGLPELNRKLLVRGANCAVVPGPFVSMALVSLLPFAENLLLNGDIDISISGPAELVKNTNLTKVAEEIERELRNVQLSFDGHVRITATPSEARRSSLMTLDLTCSLDLAQAVELYRRYDDHRFAFISPVPVGVSEVAGTNKCIVSVGKGEPGHLTLSAAADCRLRGASGEAVHIMNLMCGLHEKTGLHLKAIDYNPVV